MRPVLTAEEMYRCDRYTIETLGVPSEVLMERAARAIADEALRAFDTRRVLAVCGGGNNGGDGIAAARMLCEAGVSAEVYLVGAPASEGCKREFAKAQAAGVVLSEDDFSAYSLIIDALFGIGLSRAPEGDAAEVICRINASGVPVLAADIPSGVDAATGAVPGGAVRADATVTFAAHKAGTVLYPGADYAGRVACADIGIGTAGVGIAPSLFLTEKADLWRLPRRAARSNKGTFGRVLVVAGSESMSGAAYFAALGAYRAGAGIVETAVHPAVVPVLRVLLPEAIVAPYTEGLSRAIARADAVVAGPGLSQSAESCAVLRQVLDAVEERPLVLDADALNLLSKNEDLLKNLPKNTVCTPHPGEMARLLRCTVADVVSDILGTARRFAAESGAVCLLKDAHTVIAASDGTATVNTTGSNAMATGGSGDVLSGVIGAFAALVNVYDAAVLGAYVHGRAGELASRDLGEHAVLARDIADRIGLAVRGE